MIRQSRKLPTMNSSTTPRLSLSTVSGNAGSVVIHGTVSKDQALEWLDDVRDYIKRNPQVKGFPEDDKQVYETYWPKAQQEARSHPRMLKTQAALLSIFTAPPESDISLSTPLAYSDRLRVKNPKDAKFALGPPIDGGSIERWEDPTYRQVYEKILAGKWEEFDVWEMDKRADAVQGLYPRPGSPKKPKSDFQGGKAFLAPDNWELDFETTNFPDSPHHRKEGVKRRDTPSPGTIANHSD
ncbi:hypothetical protein FALCPG4_011366 [Fusarium falciforme]